MSHHEQAEQSRPTAWKAWDYDCKSGQNCYVKRHTVHYDIFSDLLPNNNKFTDIDGVVEMENGKVLFLEFKLGNRQLSDVQRILHENLSSKERQSSLVVWRGEDGRPTKCQWITRGKERDVMELPQREESLKAIIQTWMAI